jgi:hypothetical protein
VNIPAHLLLLVRIERGDSIYDYNEKSLEFKFFI